MGHTQESAAWMQATVTSLKAGALTANKFCTSNADGVI